MPASPCGRGSPGEQQGALQSALFSGELTQQGPLARQRARSGQQDAAGRVQLELGRRRPASAAAGAACDWQLPRRTAIRGSWSGAASVGGDPRPTSPSSKRAAGGASAAVRSTSQPAPRRAPRPPGPFWPPVQVQGGYRYHQYQVVGRHLPTERDPEPTIYRMKMWAQDPVRAKSKFWCVPGLLCMLCKAA